MLLFLLDHSTDSSRGGGEKALLVCWNQSISGFRCPTGQRIGTTYHALEACCEEAGLGYDVGVNCFQAVWFRQTNAEEG